jgi:hypothetical protein
MTFQLCNYENFRISFELEQAKREAAEEEKNQNK